jgi:ubiquitin-protein ligase
VNPRQRRLAADFAELAQAFDGSPHVTVEPLGSLPPERYRVTYRIPGLQMVPPAQLVRSYEHVFEIALPAGYPRQQPYAVPLTPVFHPNISGHVCIADFWSPSQSLVDTVVQIADMVQYRLFNINSPLNAVAARWAETNAHQIPVGRYQVRTGDPAAPAAPIPAQSTSGSTL